MHHLPERFVRTVEGAFGKAGRRWLDRLPALLVDCARRWELTIGAPFALSYNYVAPATRADGRKSVLKVGVPSGELLSEIAALRHYDGRGMVRLLAADPERGALLLERLEPGTTLAELEDDEERTAIAARVMRQLRCPAPNDHSWPTVASWATGLERLRARFDGGSGPLPPPLVARAEGLFAELLASMGEPVLLHGDLHHWNILAAGRQPWLGIDPKGVVGEAEYEVGALLRNPMPHFLDVPEPRRLLARRVDRLADELGFDRQRIIGWGVAQAVLAAAWTVEEGGEPASLEGWLACAGYLAELG